eukprot:s4624_g1.t1
MEDDFKGLATPGNILHQYAHVKQKAIWGGNLRSLVETSLELITDTVNQSQDPSQLEIDMVFVWMGNELCGRRGVFIDPGEPKSKLRNAVIQPHVVEAPLERQHHQVAFPTPLLTSGFMKARPADYVGINYQDDLDLMEMLGYTDELTCPSEPEGPADYVGINYQDDLDLMEMLGYTDELTCPSEPEGEGMITVLPEVIPLDHLPRLCLSEKVLHHMTGLVRGAKQKFKSRIGKWIKISELIDVLWRSRQVTVGTRHILAVVAYDSKGRFNIAGHSDDPRRDFIETDVWPSWICASRGRNAKIQDQLVDADIATCWYTNDDRSEIGDTATYQGRQFLAKAKQQLKLAVKKGYSTILERFGNDVESAMHSVSAGYDREFLAIEDLLTQAALPNQGRSKEQRHLGVGSYGGGAPQHSSRNVSIARVLYLHDSNPAALRAGLISAVSDDPFCIMWLGGTYSIRKFVDVFLQHKIVQAVVTFTDSPIHLNADAEQWHDWIRGFLAPQADEIAADRAPLSWTRQVRQSNDLPWTALARVPSTLVKHSFLSEGMPAVQVLFAWLFLRRSLPFEVVRLFLPDAYEGWQLRSLQSSFDDVDTSRLWRWTRDDYIHVQRISALVDKMKDREHMICGLVTVNVCAVVVAFCIWCGMRSRGSCRPWPVKPESCEVLLVSTSAKLVMAAARMAWWRLPTFAVFVALPVLLSWLPRSSAWQEFQVRAIPKRESFSKEPLAQLIASATSSLASGGHCPKPTRVVVTLSTFEGRLGRLKGTVASLSAQSCMPDAIYIFLSRRPRTKRTGAGFGGHGDGVDTTEALESLRDLSDRVIVRFTDEDWGPGTKLLAALKVEEDPNTWLITVDDDTTYHQDTVLALVLAASALPSHAAPGFWCEEARATGVASDQIQWQTLEIMSDATEGTVHGWCGGFAGVLFKRWFFDETVFNFTDAPDGCAVHDDVWFGGHLLSKGNTPYLINAGFFSAQDGPSTPEDRQDFSINVINRQLKASGKDPQEQCAAWFSAFRGQQFSRPSVFTHPSVRAPNGEDLWVLKNFFQLDALSNGPLPRSGKFVELGASDGLTNTSTYFLEKELGWHGIQILAESSEAQIAQLTANRPKSVSLQGVLCGQNAAAADPPCRSLQQLLQEGGLQRHRVNYLVANFRGSELEAFLRVLAQLPFKDVDVDLVQVGTHQSRCKFAADLRRNLVSWRSWHWSCAQKDHTQQLIELMERNGYSLAGMLLVDVGTDLYRSWLPFRFVKNIKAEAFFRPL